MLSGEENEDRKCPVFIDALTAPPDELLAKLSGSNPQTKIITTGVSIVLIVKSFP